MFSTTFITVFLSFLVHVGVILLIIAFIEDGFPIFVLDVNLIPLFLLTCYVRIILG